MIHLTSSVGPIKRQPHSCSLIPKSSCLLSMLQTLVYGHCRGTLHADFPKRWEDFSVMVPCRHILAYILVTLLKLLKLCFVDFVIPFGHVTPGPLLIKTPFPSLSQSASGNSLSSVIPSLKCLFTRSSILLAKITLSYSVRRIPSLPSKCLPTNRVPYL